MSDIEQRISGHGNIFSGAGDVRVKIVQNVSPTEMEEDLGLKALLTKVKHFWIKGVLENSVFNATFLELGKTMLLGTVEHPWETVLELPDQKSHTLDETFSIASLFEDVVKALLIIGEPGSGKTTTLLELARDLIQAAESDNTYRHPVPVVFNLSTWSSKRQPLFDWLASELTTRYQVADAFSGKWIQNHRLLILLDGLDEVAPDHHAKCVEAINAYVQQYGVPGIVVCSRRSEYLKLPVRLRLNAAICLQPLSTPQVSAYLDQSGYQLTGLKSLIQEDRDMQTLSQSPLMLNLMILTYQHVPLGELKKEKAQTLEARRKKLFNSYVEKMFKRKGKTVHPYDKQKIIGWLGWLAKAINQHSLNVFQIEHIQPSWLENRWQRFCYTVITRLAFFTLSVLSVLFIIKGEMFIGLPKGAAVHFKTLFFGFVLIGGSLLGVTDLFIHGRLEAKDGEHDKPDYFSFPRMGLILIHIIFFCVVVLLAFAPFITSVTVNVYFPENQVKSAVKNIDNKTYTPPPSATSSKPETLVGKKKSAEKKGAIEPPVNNGINYMQGIDVNRLVRQLAIILILGTGIGFAYGTRIQRRGLRNDIQLSEMLRWSFKKAWRGIPFGVLAGILAVYLSTEKFGIQINLYAEGGISHAVPNGPSGAAAGIYALVSVIAGLLGMLLGGIDRKAIFMKTRPNQGIILTLRNAVIVGLIFGLLSTLMTIWLRGVAQAVVAGFFAALIVGLWMGGIDVLQHYLLRMIFSIKRYAPLDYSRLLDHATRLIFTQKVGAGYIFIHRFLLEHFASYLASDFDHHNK